MLNTTTKSAVAIAYASFAVSGAAAHLYCNARWRGVRFEWRKNRHRLRAALFLSYALLMAFCTVLHTMNDGALLRFSLVWIFLLAMSIFCAFMAALNRSQPSEDASSRQRVDFYLLLLLASHLPYGFAFLCEAIMREPKAWAGEIILCVAANVALWSYVFVAPRKKKLTADGEYNSTDSAATASDIDMNYFGVFQEQRRSAEVAAPQCHSEEHKRSVSEAILSGTRQPRRQARLAGAIRRRQSQVEEVDPNSASFGSDFVEKYRSYNPGMFCREGSASEEESPNGQGTSDDEPVSVATLHVTDIDSDSL